jgi:hypothetical protein
MRDCVATVGGRFETEAIREIGGQVFVITTARGVWGRRWGRGEHAATLRFSTAS